MYHEDVEVGMTVKFWDHERQRYLVAEVIGTDEYDDGYGNEIKQVLIDDPEIPGHIISIGSGHLQPYKKVRKTHCWGSNCSAMLNSKNMNLCSKCNGGIICPKCERCMCGYNRF